MWNARLDESQARLKIAGRNINNLSYADDTTLMAEIEEKLKSLLMRVKKEIEKAGFIFSIHKTQIMTFSLITSWQIEGENMETVTNFFFPGLQKTADSDCNHRVKRHLLFGRKTKTKVCA